MPSRISSTTPSYRPTTSQATAASVDQFHSDLERVFNHDALSLARGERPMQEGDTFTADQQKELERATSRFVMSLPVSALSPELADKVAPYLNGRDPSTVTLKELGSVAGEIAQQFADELHDRSPNAFYALAAAGAAAVGYVAYAEGSKGLRNLGIKPELKKDLFNDKLTVKAQFDWDPHFRNPSLTGSVGANVGPGRLTGHTTFNNDGFDNAGLGYSLHRDRWDANLGANVNRAGDVTATGEVVYRPRDNFEIAGSASHSSNGDSRVGIGVRIKW